VDAAFRSDLARWVEVQQGAGLDFYSDGLLRWQDIFRPLVESLGIKPHTLVRWFDTNTFFREPEFSSLPSPSGGISIPFPSAGSSIPSPSGGGQGGGLISDGSVPSPRVSTFPSPFMFSRAARTSLDRNRLMVALAESVLRPVIDAAVKAGSELIHLEEPWLGYYGIAKQDWAPLRDALEAVRGKQGATLALHVYFGDAGPHLDQLRTLPVDAIGVDLIETDVATLGGGWDKGLVAGVMNGRQSLVESASSIVEVAGHLADTLRPPALYLTSNCELGFLPTSVAERKVQRLGEAANKVKELVSV
jgi:5-methyltetrahydropteroyltriglutamate--homocysteine methyltransferase